jgi:hypothetical protein
MDTSWPPASQPRSRQLKVRLTASEADSLARRAADRDLTVSELVRSVLPLQRDTPPEATDGASKTGDGGLSVPAYRER